jgi:hypothetical protein
MIRRTRSACGVVALAGALALSAHVIAKPPDLPEDGSFEVLPMPHEDTDVTCPYLRQQRIDRHVSQFADPEMSRDVFANLERLKQADNLLEMAKELGRAGFFAEAMECCVRASELCPGSPCADRAANTMLELAFGIARPTNGSEEAAEPPTCPYCPNIGKPIGEIVPGKTKP